MSDRIPERDLQAIVVRIQSGDPAGAEFLYERFARGITYHVRRQVPAHAVEDVVHNVIVALLQQIRSGDLSKPLALVGYLHTITRNKVAAEINRVAKEKKTREPIAPVLTQEMKTAHPAVDTKPNPEQVAIVRQRANGIRSALNEMRPMDREILQRFYLDEQPEAHIRAEMNLTETQFRNLKSRALDKIGGIVRRRESMTQIRRLTDTVLAA